MILNLTRPLVAMDVETHAFVQPEEAMIVELGFIMLYPDGREPLKWKSLIKPLNPITDEAKEKHGITNDMVKDAPPFAPNIARNLAHGFKDCDYCGYNIRFDLRVLTAEMKRAGFDWSIGDAALIDPLRIWSVASPRSLSDAVREFLKREPTEAHRAFGDAEDALNVALAQLERWDHLPRDTRGLHALCFEGFVDLSGKFVRVNGDVTCNFGAHRNVKLKDMPRGYLQWLESKDGPDGFPPDVRAIATNALHGDFSGKTVVDNLFKA